MLCNESQFHIFLKANHPANLLLCGCPAWCAVPGYFCPDMLLLIWWTLIWFDLLVLIVCVTQGKKFASVCCSLFGSNLEGHYVHRCHFMSSWLMNMYFLSHLWLIGHRPLEENNWEIIEMKEQIDIFKDASPSCAGQQCKDVMIPYFRAAMFKKIQNTMRFIGTGASAAYFSLMTQAFSCFSDWAESLLCSIVLLPLVVTVV